MNKLDIVTLIENHPDHGEQLLSEHGLSFFIEYNGVKLLFDSGQSNQFMKNAERLGVDLSKLDYVIMSHGHYDHSGGLSDFLTWYEMHLSKTHVFNHNRKKLSMVVGEGFFEPKYKKDDKGNLHFNGNNFSKKDIDSEKVSLIHMDDTVISLIPGIEVHRKFNRYYEVETGNPNFILRTSQGDVEDMFHDEIVLSISTNRGLLLIVGCAHVGIMNIIETIIQRTHEKVWGILGGTHLVNPDPTRLDRTIEYFRTNHIEFIGATHCTSDLNRMKIKEAVSHAFIQVNTGYRIEIEE